MEVDRYTPILLILFTYCWTLQASQSNKAFRRFLSDFSAILFASSGGNDNDSLRHTCCKTVQI